MLISCVLCVVCCVLCVVCCVLCVVFCVLCFVCCVLCVVCCVLCVVCCVLCVVLWWLEYVIVLSFKESTFLTNCICAKTLAVKKTLEILSTVFVKPFFKYRQNLTVTEGKMCQLQQMGRMQCLWDCFNPLNHRLIPICPLLALLGAHHILHVSRIRANVCRILSNTEYR